MFTEYDILQLKNKLDGCLDYVMQPQTYIWHSCAAKQVSMINVQNVNTGQALVISKSDTLNINNPVWCLTLVVIQSIQTKSYWRDLLSTQRQRPGCAVS